MSHRFLASVEALAVVWLVAIPVAGGQASSAAATTRAGAATPRTPWGDPDLQGIWTNWHQIPLERPANQAGKQVLTKEEVAELEKQTAQRRDGPPRAGQTGSYNDFWREGGVRFNQTALIVDPPDGRLPLTPEAQKRAAAHNEARFPQQGTEPATNSWEDRDAYERCITRGMPGAMIPAYYNHNYHILQTPGYVVILVEMIHEARIIPVDRRPHLDHNIRQWLGDSRGHWEGNTLVVETTNFNGKVKDRSTFAFGTGENGHLVERFTRLDADTIDYQMTADDPTAFTRPWTASMPMTKLQGQLLYEYACHEGNYGMEGILAGARALEKAEEAAKKTNKKK